MVESNNKLIAKNTIILAAQQVFSLVVSLYSSRIILQTLGVEDFGIYNVVGGFVLMFAFLNTSMSNATQRFFNYEYGKNGEKGALKVFNTAITIQFVLSIIVVILLESVGLWYLYEKLVVPDNRFIAAFWCFQFSTISLVFVIMQIPFEAAIQAHEKMTCLAVVSVLDTTIKLAIAISIKYIEGDRLIWYGFLYLMITIINFGIYIIYSYKKFPEIRLKKNKDSGLFKQMLSFSGWNLIGSFAGVAKEQGINVLLNFFFGPIVNASRGIAYQVAGALKSFTSNVTISGRPQLVQSYARNDITRTMNIMFSMSKFSYLIVLLFSIPVMFEIDYILKIWLSTQIPDNTSLFVNLVIVMSLVESLGPPVSFVVHATGRMSKFQLVNSIISLSIIPLSYILLKQGYAPESVFYLGIVILVIAQISSILILRQLVYFSLWEYIKVVIAPLFFVSIVLLIVPTFIIRLMDSGFLRLLCVTISSTVVILTTSYFGVLNASERDLALTIINKVIKRKNND